jgi:hypothetical protein
MFYLPIDPLPQSTYVDCLRFSDRNIAYRMQWWKKSAVGISHAILDRRGRSSEHPRCIAAARLAPVAFPLLHQVGLVSRVVAEGVVPAFQVQGVDWE